MTTLLAYLLIALFLFLEGRLRRGRSAKSLERGQSDRGSTGLIGGAFLVTGLALLSAPVLNHFGVARVCAGTLGWIGLGIAILGIALRVWANRTLGQFYTRTLRVTEDQPIIERAPYRLIRHPGYLGVLLLWVGSSLAAVNWITVLIASLVMFPAYAYRIRAEEAMLATARSHGYAAYQARTWKLIPFVF